MMVAMGVTDAQENVDIWNLPLLQYTGGRHVDGEYRPLKGIHHRGPTGHVRRRDGGED